MKERKQVDTTKISFHFCNTYIASLEEERNSSSSGDESSEKELLTPNQRHQMKHSERFFSRQVQTIPATYIRGKCSVTLLNETESIPKLLKQVRE